jgi:hypothetical protein
MQTDADKMNDSGNCIELQPVRKIGRHIENRRVEGSVQDADPGSIGSVCFWATWIRIRIRNLFVQIWIRLIPSTAKKNEENP